MANPKAMGSLTTSSLEVPPWQAAALYAAWRLMEVFVAETPPNKVVRNTAVCGGLAGTPKTTMVCRRTLLGFIF